MVDEELVDYNILPAITRDSVIEAVMIMLWRAAGVNDPYLMEHVLRRRTALRMALPDLHHMAADIMDASAPENEALIRSIQDQRDKMATQLLRNIPQETRDKIMQRVARQFADADDSTLYSAVQRTLDEAIELCDATAPNNRPHVRIIRRSALDIFKDLEVALDEPVAWKLGNPVSVPTAMTVDELIRHCAWVCADRTSTRFYAMRKAAEYITGEPTPMPACGEDTDPADRLRVYARNNPKDHNGWVEALRAARKRWVDTVTG